MCANLHKIKNCHTINFNPFLAKIGQQKNDL